MGAAAGVGFTKPQGLGRVSAQVAKPAATTNQFGIAEGDDKYASRTFAAISRAQFDDYKQRYRPLERQLIGAFDNAADRQNLTGQATGFVNQGFANADAQFRRRSAGLGATLTPEQEQSYQRSQGLRQGLAQVQAVNSTTRQLRDRDLSLLAGNALPQRNAQSLGVAQ